MTMLRRVADALGFEVEVRLTVRGPAAKRELAMTWMISTDPANFD